MVLDLYMSIVNGSAQFYAGAEKSRTKVELKYYGAYW